MLYIRQVRVASPGTTNQHITHVKYSGTKTGPLTTVSRDAVLGAVDHGEVYTYNNVNGTQARVTSREGDSGRRYITTIADRRETNNLLELPRFV